MIAQLIGIWALLGMAFFIGSDTPKLFKSKKWAIVAHGPLVWYAVLCGKITWQFKAKDKNQDKGV